jgi:hypothetical protein
MVRKALSLRLLRLLRATRTLSKVNMTKQPMVTFEIPGVLGALEVVLQKQTPETQSTQRNAKSNSQDIRERY